MAHIRVAIIGLSQSAKTSWASQAHLPYLLTERGRERYKIVALCNSSEEAAKRAIKAYDLPADVKAYGSPHDLAANPDIDLVVCTTRVDVHYDTIEPSVKAGKNVFVEWPLAENVGRATKLADEAKQSGSKTLIGLQARVAPSVLKLKEVIEGGTIGKVVSSDVIAYTPGGGGDSISEGLAYFMDKKIGGNPVTIALGHSKINLTNFRLLQLYANKFQQSTLFIPSWANTNRPTRICRFNGPIRRSLIEILVQRDRSSLMSLILFLSTALLRHQTMLLKGLL